MQPPVKQCKCCGANLARCIVCKRDFPAPRTDAQTCSAACRSRLYYRRQKQLPITDSEAQT